jgi:hypothetical protein
MDIPGSSKTDSSFARSDACAAGTYVTMVRLIQQTQGDAPCFASGRRCPGSQVCEWREDCVRSFGVRTVG